MGLVFRVEGVGLRPRGLGWCILTDPKPETLKPHVRRFRL